MKSILDKMLQEGFDLTIQSVNGKNAQDMTDKEMDLAEGYYRKGFIDCMKMFEMVRKKEVNDLVAEPLLRRYS